MSSNVTKKETHFRSNVDLKVYLGSILTMKKAVSEDIPAYYREYGGSSYVGMGRVQNGFLYLR